MRKKVLFMIAVNIVLCFTACVNKEQKAFDEAFLSSDIAKMKAFINNYPEADRSLLDSAKMIISEWETDSADFAYISQEKDLLKRFVAEEKYIEKHQGGNHLEEVYRLYEKDEDEAEALKAKAAVVNKKMELYNKRLKNKVFYSNPRNGIVLLPPNAEGKGQGVLFENRVNPFRDIIHVFFDFHYTIDLEDLDDDDLFCKMDKYSGTFTVTLYEKKIYLKAKGDIDIYLSEPNEEFYKLVEDRVAKINNGEEVMGNPHTTISVY